MEFGKYSSEKEVMEGYQKFKSEKSSKKLISISEKYRIEPGSLETFVNGISVF